MKSVNLPVLRGTLVAALIATVGFTAFAQSHSMGHSMGDGDKGHERMGKMDPAKMQVMMDKRNAGLKAKLKITPAQEGAWTAYTTAMKPPADMAKTHDTMRTEMQKLTTPERIEKMKAMRTMRDAEMDKRSDAVKTFYAALTSEQKAVFDALHMGGQRGGRHG
jgi:Spy/CpxP family protein refolding chaperone